MQSVLDLRLVQFDPSWLNPEENTARASRMAKDQAADGADLIVFPELNNVGYVTPIRVGQPMEYRDPDIDEAGFAALYMDKSESVDGPYIASLFEVASNFGCHIISGMSRVHGSSLMNSSVLIGPNGVIGIQDKLHLPPQEKPFFTAGSSLGVFDTPIAQIGLAICYDSRFPEMARYQARNGAELVVVVYAGADSVIPYLGTDEILVYRSHVRAQENGIFFAMCNRRGAEGNSKFIGRSCVAAPNGAIIARGDGEQSVVQAELRAEELEKNRSVVDVFADLRSDVYG